MYRTNIILSTESGEVPTPEEVERLIEDQMSGVLDEDTGLTCISVQVVEATGELE